jgi:hypothetical protein
MSDDFHDAFWGELPVHADGAVDIPRHETDLHGN